MKKRNQLYALGLALLFTAAFPACTQNDDEPGGQQPEGKIILSPAVALEGWNGPGGTDTRADQQQPFTLAAGGKLLVGILKVKEGGLELDPDYSPQMNYFTVTDDGKLSRLPFSGTDDNETEAPLNIPGPGEYGITVIADVIGTLADGVSFKTHIDTEGGARMASIAADGKFSISCKIRSAGLRLNVKSHQGGAYRGADITANLKNLTAYSYSDPGLEEKTLTADSPHAMWGDLRAADVTASGTVLFELAVAGKNYTVKAPRQITWSEGRLYTFNVRVGATSIIVSSDDLSVGDFEVEQGTNAEAEYTPFAVNGHEALPVNGYWVADASPEGEENVTYKTTLAVRDICPAGWRLPTQTDYEIMSGIASLNSSEQTISADARAEFVAAFPYYSGDYDGCYYGAFRGRLLDRFFINRAETTLLVQGDGLGSTADDDKLIKEMGYRVRCVREMNVPLYNGLKPNLVAMHGCTAYYVAPVDAATNIKFEDVNFDTICPEGWKALNKYEYREMIGDSEFTDWDEVEGERYAAISAAFPAGRGYWCSDSSSYPWYIYVQSPDEGGKVIHETKSISGGDLMNVRCVRKRQAN